MPVPALPEELWRIIGSFVYRPNDVDHYAREWARKHPPKTALKQYEEVCKFVAGLNRFEEGDSDACCRYIANGVSWYLVNLDTLCRDMLKGIFRAYGWNERLRLENYHGGPEVIGLIPGYVVTANEGETIDVDSASHTQLLKQARLHAARYVTDDESDFKSIDMWMVTVRELPNETIAPSKWFENDGVSINYELHGINIDEVKFDYDLLSFEYVTDKPVFEDRSLQHNDVITTWNHDVRRWNPKLLTDASSMFQGFVRFGGVGVGEWTMPKLKIANRMFCACLAFDANLKNWQPAALEDATRMFERCERFTGLGLDAWATHLGNLTSAASMFKGCKKLNLEKIQSWQLTNAEVDITWMFRYVPINERDIQFLQSMRVNMSGMVEKWRRRNALRSSAASFEDVDVHMANLIFSPYDRPTPIINGLVDVVRGWRTSADA